MDSPCAFMNVIIRFMIAADHDLTHEYENCTHAMVASFLIVVMNR